MQAVRLVSTKELSHDDWLEWRRKGIGGSDVAAICEVSKYRSKMNVYLDKLGLIPPLDDNPKMKAGRMLEPLIAEWFAQDTGKRVMKQNSIFQHKEYPFMLANIDRWVIGENAGLEIKNTFEFNRNEWYAESVPREYLLQANHYMAVTGAKRWYVAVLIGGWDFQWRVVERDEEIIKLIVEYELDFWNNHVMPQIPPPVSHHDTDYLNETYAESITDSKIELEESTYEIIQNVTRYRIEEKRVKEGLETCKNQIKAIMQDKELAYFQGELCFTWKANKNGVRAFKIIGGE